VQLPDEGFSEDYQNKQLFSQTPAETLFLIIPTKMQPKMYNPIKY
jgi:hypothetical protein